MDFTCRDFAGVLIQYPDTEGRIFGFENIIEQAHIHGVSLLYFELFFLLFPNYLLSTNLLLHCHGASMYYFYFDISYYAFYYNLK